MREQPSLTTSTGGIWLVVGGAFVVIALLIVIPMMTLPPAGLAVGAAIAIGALYVAMIVTRLVVPPGRGRLGTMAVAMLLIAATALVAVVGWVDTAALTAG